MNILLILVRILFVLFFCYTFLYICQWVSGLITATDRLGRFTENKQMVLRLCPDPVVQKLPVTVLIPAYNEEACIGETVRSLLAENYPNLQILVVDDGSRDRTEAALTEQFGLAEIPFAEGGSLKTQKLRKVYYRQVEGKKLFLLCKENGGKSDALNCGLNYCKSPYCLILDADTKVERGSIRILVSQFLADPTTIVCAGSVGNGLYGTRKYRKLGLFARMLVVFQKLEYFRTFYMQRVLFDRINANNIVSGAFAMFDTELLKNMGGYQKNTIGEDMELTMRLHAFCKSQKRPYRIAYMPEARCSTQVPFHYRDYYQQRRRWHIGMIQSLKRHGYMLDSTHYGWAGFMASTFMRLYELYAPFIELVGFLTLILASLLDILTPAFTLWALAIYSILAWLSQLTLLWALKLYRVEHLSFRDRFSLGTVIWAELIFFHFYNLFIKLNAFFSQNRHQKTWKHITRSGERRK